MPQISLQQALFHRPDGEPPRLLARSSGFDEAWLAEAEHLIHGFGERADNLRCPLAVFAKPLTSKQIAVVRVKEDPAKSYSTGLYFHFTVVAKKVYEEGIRDPFMLAEKVEPAWTGQDWLPSLMIAAEAFSPRSVAQVQGILKRVKAAALREGEDPEAPDFERTVENSESPALLGGAQVLVDGGRLIFERRDGDLRMVAGLWLLLPEMTRCRLWPTSFAFSDELDFDVLVVPRLDTVLLESYTTEDQAADYPEGRYELALQQAAETSDQRELDAVFSKRDSRQTIRLALSLLILVSGLVLCSRWLQSDPAPPARSGPLTIHQQQVAAAAGIVACGDEWTALGMLMGAKTIWRADQELGKK